jgi:NAD(P)-dependent dehydrogenase (short-subunit alcohol dehydrogenase family)
MHTGGDPGLNDPQWSLRRWNGSQAYSDTKLHDLLLAFGVARRWPEVLTNALSPGWVPTRMGGPGAPDDLEQGHLTQAWLAVSEDPGARVTGRYFYHQRPRDVNPTAQDPALQDRLLDYCRERSGVSLA